MKIEELYSGKAPEAQAARRAVFISMALIVILGFAIYGNTANNKFVLDDYYLIRDNVFLGSFSNLPKIFTQDTGAAAGEKYNYFRPLPIFTYMVEYHLWKLDVRGYHFVNTILHILAALALYWFIFFLFKDRIISLFTSLLFVAHPVQVEAVAYLSGRDNIMAVLFLLLSFIFYIKFINKEKAATYVLTLLLYILALLSKEFTLMFPALAALYHYIFKKKVNIKAFIGIFSTAGMYILLRIAVLPSLQFYGQGFNETIRRIPGFFVAITNYLKLLFAPFNLHIELGEEFFKLSDPKAIIGIGILLLLLAAALTMRRRNRLVSFSIAWFLLALLPVSNIYPLGAYMAQRWLYLPAVGFFLIMANVLSYVYRNKYFKAVKTIPLIILLAGYSYLTIIQNTYWRDPIVFYKRSLEYLPRNFRLHDELGAAYYNIGKNKLAITAHRKALEINPNYESAYNNLANAYFSLGATKEAVSLYKKAIFINPDSAKIHFNLGNAYFSLGKREEAISSYQKAVSINPNYADAYNNLGIAYSSRESIKKAKESFKEAIKIDPSSAKAHNNIAIIYVYEERYDLAIKHLERALELGYEVRPEALEKLNLIFKTKRNPIRSKDKK